MKGGRAISFPSPNPGAGDQSRLFFMKLAVCQMALSNNLDNNAAQILRFMEKAAAQEVKLICFPEMSLTGYSSELLSSLELNLIVGKVQQQIEEKCNELQLGAVIGYGYRKGDNLFNRAGAILPGSKGIQFTYDKNYLTKIEEKYFQPGLGTLVFPYQGTRIGIIICRDQNYPLLTKKLRDEGAEYIFILAAHYYNSKEARWKLDKNKAIPITRAVENKVYVLLSNTVGTHLGMISLGNSLIADPEGAVVVAADECQEGLLLLSTGYTFP